ncbi:MAG TPA: hypothetical protein VFI65_18385 [Streptosporangiaceae bacterium]|nr:hypothetical protein [Streptosporangiaceae bacterium]
MTDARSCAQCGTEFLPLREHARFCSPRCRIAWNRRNALDPAADGTLPWAVTAMRAATSRLLAATTSDPASAFMVVTEAVWWVTLVDATLVRYHQAAYGRLLARHDDNERQTIEDTFAGLRFVRNQMGREPEPGDLICPPRQLSRPGRRVAEWTWAPVCKPVIAAQPGPGQKWEHARRRSYQAQLSGHPIGITFTQAAAFLQQAWATIRAETASSVS